MFPGTYNDKLFQNIQNYRPFLPQFGPKWTLLEKWARLDFKYFTYVPLCIKENKTNDPLLRKMPNWLTDRKRNRQWWFYRSLHKTQVQKTEDLSTHYPQWLMEHICQTETRFLSKITNRLDEKSLLGIIH